MRLNDTYLQAIVYLGCARHGTEHAIDTHGTGFLLTHEGHVYLVTAAHVAVDFVDGPMDVRLNTSLDGRGRIEPIEQTNWVFHQDDTVDVAVMPFEIPSWSNAVPLKSKWVASEFKIGTKNFGVGDMAYVVGIFNKMRGESRNVPVVHTGYVASLASGENLLFEDWRIGAGPGKYVNVQGHIVQVPTLPESSGSPVFIRRSISGTIPEPGVFSRGLSPARSWVYGSVWLLGLWSGRWENDENGVTVGTNMGLCVPAPKIFETLDKPELVNMRKESKQREQRANALTPQSSGKRKRHQTESFIADAEKSGELNPDHRRDFETLLGNVAPEVPTKKK